MNEELKRKEQQAAEGFGTGFSIRIDFPNIVEQHDLNEFVVNL